MTGGGAEAEGRKEFLKGCQVAHLNIMYECAQKVRVQAGSDNKPAASTRVWLS